MYKRQILYGIGQALGMGSLLDNWKTPRDVFELLKKCSKGMPVSYTHLVYGGASKPKLCL